jgi:hypothetical protein
MVSVVCALCISELIDLLTDLNAPLAMAGQSRRAIAVWSCRTPAAQSRRQNTRTSTRFDQPAALSFTFVTKRFFPGDFVDRECMHCPLCQADIVSIHDSSFAIFDVTTGPVEAALAHSFGKVR